MPAQGIFVLLDQNEAKTGTKCSSAKLNQGLDDDMLKSFYPALNISEPFRYATLLRYVFNALSNDFLTHYRPRPNEKDCAITTKNRASTRMSPRKILTIVGGGTTVPSECSSDEAWTLGRYQVSRLSGMEDKRKLIINIASKELGTKEATGNNDGPRVEEYLAYTGLGQQHEWCAAFVSWCYGQAGLPAPRNPWSPALFPQSRRIDESKVQAADLFAIYSTLAKRIYHVGLVKERVEQYLLTIEGNSNNRVESRRRHIRTIYTYSKWFN